MARWRGCTPGRRDTPDATLDNRSREERHTRLDAHRGQPRGQLGVVARPSHERWQPECRHPHPFCASRSEPLASTTQPSASSSVRPSIVRQRTDG